MLWWVLIVVENPLVHTAESPLVHFLRFQKPLDTLLSWERVEVDPEFLYDLQSVGVAVGPPLCARSQFLRSFVARLMFGVQS